MEKYFQIRNEDKSAALEEALNVAFQIIKSSSKAIIQCKVNNRSAIADILIEFHEIDSTLNSFEIETRPFTLDQKLIDYAKNVNVGDPGFKKLVFFIAMLILEEVSHLRHVKLEKNADISVYAKNQILKGYLQLVYDKDIHLNLIETRSICFKLKSTDTLSYYIKQSDNASNTVEIPIAPNNEYNLKGSLFKSKMVQINTEIEIDQSVQLNVTFTNTHYYSIKIPYDFVDAYFSIILVDPNHDLVLPYRSAKSTTVDPSKLFKLDPNCSHLITTCLSNLYPMKLSGIYHISVRFRAISIEDEISLKSNKQEGGFIYNLKELTLNQQPVLKVSLDNLKNICLFVKKNN